ncbi:hypothetical protein KIN20_009505 [Parelaphostrongylus tenuis]|uniref:Uncharacterized protein n=1 Tax=Parelaphostrongylus tenuis TaxID=148309 RepID=A0AAD5MSL4_PARTN|nr:hypothetical protein KIN20_009505 [Parelaphostrongylus tenuis]
MSVSVWGLDLENLRNDCFGIVGVDRAVSVISVSNADDRDDALLLRNHKKAQNTPSAPLQSSEDDFNEQTTPDDDVIKTESQEIPLNEVLDLKNVDHDTIERTTTYYFEIRTQNCTYYINELSTENNVIIQAERARPLLRRVAIHRCNLNEIRKNRFSFFNHTYESFSISIVHLYSLKQMIES